MINSLRTVHLAKHIAKLFWRLILDIDYLPVEYCFNRGFHFLIPSKDDWDHGMIVPPELPDVYTDGSKLDSGVGSGVYSEKLNLNISLRLPDYCSVSGGSNGHLSGCHKSSVECCE